jgi:hypothetical protein
MTTSTRPGLADVTGSSELPQPQRPAPGTPDSYALIRELTSLRRRVVALEEDNAELSKSISSLREDFKILHAMYTPFRTAPYSSSAPIIETVRLSSDRPPPKKS